jgi:hypothetical protein
MVNPLKSTLHHSGIQQEDLDSYKEIFPYKFADLTDGFRYLGYFLKPVNYKVEDWHWLIAKFEKRIGHWCNRWLSLGGRFVLIKAVLESMHVYWMALESILMSVLNRIRQLMFNFLWSGSSVKQHIHLCKWEIIAKPKIFGGWGIRNIYLFNRSLVENTLWRVLMKDDIWHRVIKDKYLPYSSVFTWLRSTTQRTTNASQTWRNLVKSINVITHWLSWSPGSGHSVIIGKDKILGLGNFSLLSQELLASLKWRNIYFLFQARGSIRPGTICAQWKASDDLGLMGEQAIEWDLFCRALIFSGVQLQDRPDELKWIGGDRSGTLTARNVYNALASKLWPQPIGGWQKKLWTWDLAPKIKYFTWLFVENKILTWDNLQSRGWSGPSICSLCLKKPETVMHLLVNCCFTQQVWFRIKKSLSLKTLWMGSSLNSCFESWLRQCSSHPTLPSLISWHVWLEHNKVLFENGRPSIHSVVCKTLGGFGRHRDIQKVPVTRSTFH